jgi:hypothetical protein
MSTPLPKSSHRWSSLAKPALAAVLASGFIGLTAGEAHSLVVNVGGQNYDVTTFTGSYNDNISKFETPDNGGEMPWWATNPIQYQTAVDFADAVNIGLGVPNLYGGTILLCPIFAYYYNVYLLYAEVYFYYPDASLTLQTYILDPADTSITYAIATPAAPSSPPVPSPLPIFGAAAAFGASRQLRKRIKRSGHSLPSTYGL